MILQISTTRHNIILQCYELILEDSTQDRNVQHKKDNVTKHHYIMINQHNNLLS